MARVSFRAWGLAFVSIGVSACADEADTAARPARGSIGEELYGVVCDRIGAQALPEDLTGASFRGVCHRAGSGQFAVGIDEALLPPSLDARQTATRAHALARVGALARRRGDLIGALDALFPTGLTLTTHDGPRADGTPGCEASGERALGDELAGMLGRMAPAYDDGTVPEATRALGRLMQAIQSRPEAQTAFARFGSHEAYRPHRIALGAVRPVLAYPELRDLMRATSKVLSPDADPYAVDARGAHVVVPGTAFATLAALEEATSFELRTAKADAGHGPIGLTHDPVLGLDRISRARSVAEAATYVLSAEHPAFGAPAQRFLVRRDTRGIALVQTDENGTIPAPFADVDRDGLADVDGLGRFLLTDGTAAPSPFLAPWVQADATPRDESGRAQRPSGGPLLYSYMDTSRTYAAALLRDLAPMVNADPAAQHETVMDALAGAYVVLGPRVGAPTATRTYALEDGTRGTVEYDAFRGDLSPLVDLVYAGGQLLADPNADGALATTSWLMASHEPELAHLVDAALKVKALAGAHPEAQIPATSALWDDVLDVVAKIAAVTDKDGSPGLLVDLLGALADEKTAPLGDAMATLAENHDVYDYARADVNGPAMNVSTGVLGGPMASPVDRAKAPSGFDRSLFFRFLQLVHDTRGVSVCNREGAMVKALFNVPVLGNVDISIPDNLLVRAFWGKSSFGECEVFKIDDMASFYVRSIVKDAQYVLRDKQLRDGVTIDLGVTKLGVSQTATTVGLLQASCDLTGYQPPGTTDPAARTGFWTDPTSKELMTRPQWLNRNLFFANGVPASAPKPSRADTFSKALNPDHAGTSVCPKREVKDPLDPADVNYTPGGIIRLPKCDDGDWLDQRDGGTVFALEQNGFYEAIAPVIAPFVARGKADLLVALLDALYVHWADARGDANECRLAPGASCTKDGAVTYEPLVAATLREVLPALRDVSRALTATDAPQPFLACATRDASGACLGTRVSALRAMATFVKGAVDPAESARRGLIDRHGKVTALRNDGTTNAQVTPAYLFTAGLAAMDAAFDQWKARHPDDGARFTQWRRARSQLVDQLLSADATNGWHFRDAALPAIAPRVVEALRQQLAVRCPEWPSQPCAWAGTQLASDLSDAVSGPMFAHAVDVMDALRADPDVRARMEKLITYLLDEGSSNDALASLLATSDDLAQVLGDQSDIVPLLHAVGAAMVPRAGEKNLLDANLALLTRLTSPALGAEGQEQCGREIDPNQILTRVLEQAVTPMAEGGRAPLEVIMDVIGDVNRVAPEKVGPMAADDYASVSAEVSSFLLDEQRGLEQFYAIVRNATQ